MLTKLTGVIEPHLPAIMFLAGLLSVCVAIGIAVAAILIARRRRSPVERLLREGFQ